MIKPIEKKIVELYKKNLSIRSIAKELNITKSTVHYTISKLVKSNKLEKKSKSDYPILDKAENINIKDYKKCLDELKYEKENFPKANDNVMSKKMLAKYNTQIYSYDLKRQIYVAYKGYIYPEDVIKKYKKL